MKIPGAKVVRVLWETAERSWQLPRGSGGLQREASAIKRREPCPLTGSCCSHFRDFSSHLLFQKSRPTPERRRAACPSNPRDPKGELHFPSSFDACACRPTTDTVRQHCNLLLCPPPDPILSPGRCPLAQTPACRAAAQHRGPSSPTALVDVAHEGAPLAARLPIQRPSTPPTAPQCRACNVE